MDNMATNTKKKKSSGGGSSIKKLGTAKKQIDTLKKKMNDLSTQIDTFSTQLNVMMKGNGTDSYWQGQNAIDWYNKAIKGLKDVANNYSNSYAEFEDFTILYHRGLAKSKYKIKNKQALKAFTGAEFRQGVKKNKEDKKIKGVLSTVRADAVNDDQTTQSYKAYNALRTAMNGMMDSLTSMGTTWDEVATNTGGKMKSDAKSRSKAVAARKRQVKGCLTSLETDYIGDILFSNR